MNRLAKQEASIKLKSLDFIISILFASDYLRQKIKIISDRCVEHYNGFKFSYNSHENGEIEFIRHLSNIYKDKKFIFFDVGAHHGTYTAMIQNYFDNSNGFLFEPTPDSFKILTSNFLFNNSLSLHNCALSNFTGDAEFISYPDDPTRNGLFGVGKEIVFTSKDIICQVIRGDDFCQTHGIESFNLLKIDAEGHDFNVICGFEKLISTNSIDVIQFEYTFKHSDLNISLRKYYDFFMSHGYLIGPIRKSGIDFYHDFDPRFNEFQNGPNYIAVKLDLVDSFREFR